VGRTSNRIQVPHPGGTSEPTVGEIKRALHALARSTANLPPSDAPASLREAHDLLRQLARSNGIDPDDAVQQRRAAAKSLREQLVRASRSRCG
jgi:hypothetical protein